MLPLEDEEATVTMSMTRDKSVRIRPQKNVPTSVKDSRLIASRRLQIIEAAVGLFTAQGFHQTTTRQIAQAAGLSVGSMYEYVRSKEDILYLVCDHIHAAVEARMGEAIGKAGDGRDALVQAVAAYFAVCDDLSDDILLIYQETKSLAPEARGYVLGNESRLTQMFADLLGRAADRDGRPADGRTLGLLAHNIVVLGHMWTFRRWVLGKEFRLEEYIDLQTDFLLREINGRPAGQTSPREG